MSLETLQTEKVNLSGMMLDINESISTTEKELEQSFLGSADTDKISIKLSKLKTKRGSLSNAINSAEQAIIDEQNRLIDEEKQTEINARKEHVVSALAALEKAVELQCQLSEQLQKFTEHQAAANLSSTELSNQPRAITGRLAKQFNLYGGLAMAATIPLLSGKDTARLQSKIS